MIRTLEKTIKVKIIKFKNFLTPLLLIIFVSLKKLIDSFMLPVSFNLILAIEQYEKNIANKIINMANDTITENAR